MNHNGSWFWLMCLEYKDRLQEHESIYKPVLVTLWLLPSSCQDILQVGYFIFPKNPWFWIPGEQFPQTMHFSIILKSFQEVVETSWTNLSCVPALNVRTLLSIYIWKKAKLKEWRIVLWCFSLHFCSEENAL